MADRLNKRFRCPSHWTLTQRLDHYTDKSGGPDACWPWTGLLSEWGYARLFWKGRPRNQAHRLAWTVAKGAIPAGLKVLHRCDNPPCINPAHLFLGTNADNMKDMAAKGRSTRGEKSWCAKLTNKDAIAIRISNETNVVLAARYGVWPQQISAIKHRKKWVHLQ